MTVTLSKNYVDLLTASLEDTDIVEQDLPELLPGPLLTFLQAVYDDELLQFYIEWQIIDDFTVKFVSTKESVNENFECGTCHLFCDENQGWLFEFVFCRWSDREETLYRDAPEEPHERKCVTRFPKNLLSAEIAYRLRIGTYLKKLVNNKNFGA